MDVVKKQNITMHLHYEMCMLFNNYSYECMCMQCQHEVTECDCRDRLTANDAVGTTYLTLSRIASSGGEIEGIIYFLRK